MDLAAWRARLTQLWTEAVAAAHEPEDPIRQRLEELAAKAKRKRADVVASGRERLTTF